jgi:hypothetical protein
MIARVQKDIRNLSGRNIVSSVGYETRRRTRGRSFRYLLREAITAMDYGLLRVLSTQRS